jgi:RND family efflux transporter MFP subunit
MPKSTLALIVIPALAAAAGACGGAPAHDAAPERPAVALASAAVRTEPLSESFEAGGTVRALTIAPLSSRILSPILEVHVRAGERVRKGQRLVTLDARQLDAGAAAASASLAATLQGSAAADAELAAADAALALASTSHGRIAKLRERNSATQAELDDAVAMLRAAEARVTAARARRAEVGEAIDAARASARGATVSASYADITAPFDGLVTERPAEAGAMAAPGAPLVVVEDTRKYRLEISVDASHAPAIRVGAVVPVSIHGFEPMQGTVVESTEAVDAAAHSLVVKIELPGAPGLRSGLFGRARFAGPPSPGIAVPATALVRRGQLAMVFVDEGGTARMRVVHAGEVHDGRVRILAGLADGDRVIAAPPSDLLDGTPVAAEARRGR